MSQTTRRTFLAQSAALSAAVGLAHLGARHVHAAEPMIKGTPNADKLGWRVGFSAYTFRNLTLMETLDTIASIGLRHVELFSWQKFCPKNPESKPGPELSKTLRADLKKKAADLGIHMVACYTQLSKPDAAKAFFEFAADMGFEAIVSEPPAEVFDTIEKLTEEYKIDLALHNHPKPSHYWDPEVGLAALKGRGSRMGFCSDTGHWCRCGLEPAEVLKKVGPRVKTFHLKDLETFGEPKAKDAVWGQGVGHVAAILAEVKRQGLKPYFGIEWERTDKTDLSLHVEAIAYFEKTAGTLAG